MNSWITNPYTQYERITNPPERPNEAFKQPKLSSFNFFNFL